MLGIVVLGIVVVGIVGGEAGVVVLVVVLELVVLVVLELVVLVVLVLVVLVVEVVVGGGTAGLVARRGTRRGTATRCATATVGA